MHDVLFPATDAGVIGQTLGVLAVTIAAVWLVRRERALVTLVRSCRRCPSAMLRHLRRVASSAAEQCSPR